MKKALFALTLALCVMMVLSCASKPTPITTQKEADDAFSKIYQQFRGDIILDGAGSYKVVSGDTLSKIARNNYPSGYWFPLIMLASSDVVLDPDQIAPDMELTIPDLDKNLNDAKAKGKIKNFLVEIAKVYDRRNRSSDADKLRELSDTL